MKKYKLDQYCIVLIIMLLAYSSINKVLNYNAFQIDISRQPFNYEIRHTMILIPYIEFLIAVMLVFDKTQMIGLCFSSILFSIFLLYTIAALMKWFKEVPCPCGGIIKGLTWPEHLILNVFLLSISLMPMVSRIIFKLKKMIQLSV